jgi:hypothetical protein
MFVRISEFRAAAHLTSSEFTCLCDKLGLLEKGAPELT